MCDRIEIPPSHHKVVKTVALSALVAFLSWRFSEVIFFGKDSSKIYRMFRWFASNPPKLLQDPEQIYTVKLIEKEEVSHDTRRFRFELPSKDHVLGLPIGKHISLIATIDGQQVTRSYTPVSSDDDKGYFELVIKVYFKDVHPKFPDGGKLTQHLESLKVGDTMNVRGPKGRLEYHGKGEFSIKPDLKSPAEKKKFKKVSMIAGGTGIAPMLQIIRDVMKKSNVDKTEIALLFANQSEKDILLRRELEEVAAKHPNQFKYWYTIDRPEEGWKYSKGFVNKDMIKEHLHPAGDDTIILLCGPPPMITFVQGQLDELDYPKENRFKY